MSANPENSHFGNKKQSIIFSQGTKISKNRYSLIKTPNSQLRNQNKIVRVSSNSNSRTKSISRDLSSTPRGNYKSVNIAPKPSMEYNNPVEQSNARNRSSRIFNTYDGRTLSRGKMSGIVISGNVRDKSVSGRKINLKRPEKVNLSRDDLINKISFNRESSNISSRFITEDVRRTGSLSRKFEDERKVLMYGQERKTGDGSQKRVSLAKFGIPRESSKLDEDMKKRGFERSRGLMPRVIDVRTNYGEEVVRSLTRGDPIPLGERLGEPKIIEGIN